MTAVLREREERQQTDLPPRERLGRRAPQELGTIVVGGPPNRRLYVSVCRVTDLAIALAKRLRGDGEVVAVDFSERMLELAQAKADGLPIRFEVANALARQIEPAAGARLTAGAPRRRHSLGG